MGKKVHLINDAGDRIEVERKDCSKSELLKKSIQIIIQTLIGILITAIVQLKICLGEQSVMVITSNEVENVLNRIFLVVIAYNGQISSLYSKAQIAILNLDKTIANVYSLYKSITREFI